MTVRQATPDIMGDVLGKAQAVERVAVKAIKVDGGTQMRAALNMETVAEYADAMQDGWGSFPPVVLYYDGSDYWLADGFHRVAAIKSAKDAWIDDLVVPADVRAGSRRDAVLHAAGANASHGLRRTNADKRRAVETLLRDPEWAQLSDHEIARRCAVDHKTVGNLRRELASTREIPQSDTRFGADGRMIDTANIGSNQPQYVSVWELQRHVEEHARQNGQNGWNAPMLRSAARNQRNDGNYLLLEAALTVAYRRADLVQAINNVADAWESREAQQQRSREWQVVQLPADIAESGYQIQWRAADGWRVLDADGGHVQSGLSSLSECATLIRRLVQSPVSAGRPMMAVLKTAAELADDAWRADIASREAAAAEAERQAQAEIGAELNDEALLTAMRCYWSDHNLRAFASEAEPETACRRYIVQSPSGSVYEQFRIETFRGHVSIWLKAGGDYWHRKADVTYTYSRWATLTISLLPQLLPAPADIDPWAAALTASGSRQHRAEALAVALQPWIQQYQDEYGRNWRDLALHGNPSHSNSTFWRDITTEAKRRSIHIRPYDDIWKFAIKQAFSWLLANEPSEAADGAVTPVDDGKRLVDWTDDDWAAHTERSQAEPEAEPEPERQVDVDAILTPVSLRDDYDGDEWYTPAEYIEAARRVMGGIDLDPASCELAQTVVQADAYLTKFENGLGQRWIRANVWLNPPYSNPAKWIEKLLAEFDRGGMVTQAIVLVNNATETEWFQALLTRFPACFPAKRIAFWRHDQRGVTARQGQAIFYLGREIGAFINEFETFGPIVRRVD